MESCHTRKYLDQPFTFCFVMRIASLESVWWAPAHRETSSRFRVWTSYCVGIITSVMLSRSCSPETISWLSWLQSLCIWHVLCHHQSSKVLMDANGVIVLALLFHYSVNNIRAWNDLNVLVSIATNVMKPLAGLVVSPKAHEILEEPREFAVDLCWVLNSHTANAHKDLPTCSTLRGSFVQAQTRSSRKRSRIAIESGSSRPEWLLHACW